jgi:hypothetical protein
LLGTSYVHESISINCCICGLGYWAHYISTSVQLYTDVRGGEE